MWGKMTMLLELKDQIIYGPVRSRRLGRSLGINVLPARDKVCTFDCLYCQYGLAEPIDLEIDRLRFPSVDKVMAAVEKALRTLSSPPAYLTFSGNGEPTLHPRFPELVDGLAFLRNQYARHAQTAVLSNATTAHLPEIRTALSRLDVRIMKLDAGSQEMLDQYNRPKTRESFQPIIAGLAALHDVTIQSLFTGGPLGNFLEEHIEVWIEQLLLINPLLVQLYTLDRTSPSADITHLSQKDLLKLRARLSNMGINAEVF